MQAEERDCESGILLKYYYVCLNKENKEIVFMEKDNYKEKGQRNYLIHLNLTGENPKKEDKKWKVHLNYKRQSKSNGPNCEKGN